MRGKWGWAVATLSIAALVGVISSPEGSDSVADPAPARPPADATPASATTHASATNPASTLRPSPVASPTQQRAAAPRAAQQAAAARQAWLRLAQADGSQADFKHFRVSVITVRRAAETRVLARVCVRKPPDPSTRTRVSWDPWSIDVGSRTLEPKAPSADLEHVFPAEATYGVGQCAVGWLVFGTRAPIDEITYANGVGDEAIWDGSDLSAPPDTFVAPPEPAPEEEAAPEEETPEEETPEEETDEAITDYANCDELNGDYPNGVGEPGADDRTRGDSPPVTGFTESRSLYEANAESDRDGDGIACEKQ